MTEMTRLLKTLVVSPPYRAIAGHVVLPWALGGAHLTGEVLEIGAGGGAMAARMLTRFPGIQLQVTDYDPELVAVAGRLLTRFGDRAQVLWADAAELPFESGRFDAVVSAAMLHHVVRWEAAVREAIRVLRPGGLLVGYDLLHAPRRRRGSPEDSRMMQPVQLLRELRRLPVDQVRLRRSFGFAIRFQARRAG